MKRNITKLAIIALIGAFLISVSSCGNNGQVEENTTENTENTTEPTPGTVYYPPGQEPVDRPYPQG